MLLNGWNLISCAFRMYSRHSRWYCLKNSSVCAANQSSMSNHLSLEKIRFLICHLLCSSPTPIWCSMARRWKKSVQKISVLYTLLSIWSPKTTSLSWGDKCLRFVCINIYSLCMRCAIYICTHCVYIYPIYIYSTDMRGYTPLDNLSLCVYTLNIYYTLSSDYTHIYNNIKLAIKCKLYSCMFCVLLYVIENTHCYT